MKILFVWVFVFTTRVGWLQGGRIVTGAIWRPFRELVLINIHEG